jgi:hypothetical protein
MRKIVVITFILAYIGLVIAFSWDDRVKNPQALQFIENVLPVIVRDWDESALLKVVDEDYAIAIGKDWYEHATATNVHDVFYKAKSKYGKMVDFERNRHGDIGGCFHYPQQPNSISCATEIRFKKGNLMFGLQLESDSNGYKFSGFTFSSSK